MVRLEIKIDDALVKAEIARISGALENRADLHTAMAAALEETVRGHLTELGTARSPNTGYFSKAARSVESAVTPDAATVTIPHRGMALRYYGGRVVPVTMTNLAIPTENVPIRGGERLRPREMKDLAYLPAKKSAKPGTTGYLVEGMEKTTRGDKTRIIPKPGGQLMYTLREWTDHQEDPSILPTRPIMLEAITNAGLDYLIADIRAEGGAA